MIKLYETTKRGCIAVKLLNHIWKVSISNLICATRWKLLVVFLDISRLTLGYYSVQAMTTSFQIVNYSSFIIISLSLSVPYDLCRESWLSRGKVLPYHVKGLEFQTGQIQSGSFPHLCQILNFVCVSNTRPSHWF